MSLGQWEQAQRVHVKVYVHANMGFAPRRHMAQRNCLSRFTAWQARHLQWPGSKESSSSDDISNPDPLSKSIAETALSERDASPSPSEDQKLSPSLDCEASPSLTWLGSTAARFMARAKPRHSSSLRVQGCVCDVAPGKSKDNSKDSCIGEDRKAVFSKGVG